MWTKNLYIDHTKHIQKKTNEIHTETRSKMLTGNMEDVFLSTFLF